jgi:hypothetical protein
MTDLRILIAPGSARAFFSSCDALEASVFGLSKLEAEIMCLLQRSLSVDLPGSQQMRMHLSTLTHCAGFGWSDFSSKFLSNCYSSGSDFMISDDSKSYQLHCNACTGFLLLPLQS